MSKSLEELMAELEKEAKDRMNPSSKTVPDAADIVYDEDVKVPEAAETVFNADETTSDDSVTVYEDAAAGRAPASEPSYAKGETLLDTYTVDSEPIHGGMGSVWRVHHNGWNVNLAMKRPQARLFQTEKQKSNFIRECESWMRLGLHPNIVSCYYVREIDGVPTVFSEWMENGSLENHIQKGTLYTGTGQAQQERLLDIAIQFARGLHYAHEQGLIHQDVKPDNLLLSKDWDAKVADFGLARARAQLTVLERKNTVSDAGATITTPSGSYTPEYCSMEQMDGKVLTRRTDIYSWAVSVMEMYFGSRPWINGVVAGYACDSYFPDSRVSMPEKLKALLKKCLAEEPEQRPHDFAVVEKELCIIYRDVTGSDYPRPVSSAAADTADSLNNRALSFLDLGKTKEAEKLFDRALSVDPDHSKALYNRSVYQWHNGEITGEDVARYIRVDFENHFGNQETSVNLAKVYLEMGNLYNVNGYLGQAGPCEEADALRALTEKDDYVCDYELSRIRNYAEQERQRALFEEKARELYDYIEKNDFRQAAEEFMIVSTYPEYQGFHVSPDGLAIENILSRRCYPALVRSTHLVRSVTGTGDVPCSFSADSSKLLCGGALYDTESGELIFDRRTEEPGPEPAVSSTDDDDLAKLFPGLQFRSYTLKQENVYSGISPDGKSYLVRNPGETSFLRVDAETGETLAVFSGHAEPVNGLFISLDGTIAVSAGEDDTVRLWDMDGHPMTTVFSRDGAVYKAVLSYDNRRLLYMTEKSIVLTELNSGKQITVYEKKPGKYPSFVLDPDEGLFDFAVNTSFETIVIALGEDGLVSYDIVSGRLNEHYDEMQASRGLKNQIAKKVCFIHNDQFVMSSSNSKLYFWNLEADRILTMIPCADGIGHIAISRNGKYAAVSAAGRTELWRCCYSYMVDSEAQWSERLTPYAFLALARHAGARSESVLDELTEELSERGFGSVPKEAALETLRSLEAAHLLKAEQAQKKKGPVSPITTFENGFKVHEGLLFGYSGTEKDLIIPEGVIRIGRRTFEGNAYIRSIILPHGLEEIQESAFKNCTSLESVTVPDSVRKIDHMAFSGCKKLRIPKLPDWIDLSADAFDTNT